MIDVQNIPKNWSLVDFEEAVDILDSRREPINSEEREKRTSGVDQSNLYPYYGAGGQIGWIDDYIFDDELILLAEDGATTGYVYMVSGESWINNHAHVLREKPEVIRKMYLYYYLKNYNFDHLKTGGTRPKLTQTNMKKIKIPVPPSEEQEQIVEAVEERLERVERLEKSVENVGRLADEYQDSYLAYVLSGVDGDSDGFAIEGLPNDEDITYDVVELNEVVNYRSNLMNPQEEPDMIYELIELNDIEKDAGGIINVQNKRGEDIGSNKREFTNEHVLYCKLRPYLNKVVQPSFSGIASSELLVLEPTDRIVRDYLYFYLSSPMVRNRAEFLMKGANHPRLSKKDLMSFNIPVPPIEKQQKMVENITRIKSGKLKISVSDVKGLFQEYRSSVLVHAFTGGYTV